MIISIIQNQKYSPCFCSLIQRMNNLIKKKCIIFHVVLIFSVALFWLSYEANWSKSNANGMQDSSYASYSKKKGSSFENWVTCVTNWRHMQTNVSFIIKLWSLILYQIEGLTTCFGCYLHLIGTLFLLRMRR